MPLSNRNPPAGDRRVSQNCVVAGGRDGFENSHTSLQVQAACEHLHKLGPRAVHELIVELTASYGIGVVDRLAAYRRLDPPLLRALGADRFPVRVVAIDGGRQ